MDVVIPSHSVRLFCQALGSLSKIGRDLYFEFDSVAGLSVRTLSDAKSAYSCIHFNPSFFERCTAPLDTQQNLDDESFSCRVPVKALVPVIRPRKAVHGLRIYNGENCVAFDFTLEQAVLTHRVKISDAEGVCAVSNKDGASEIVASPSVLLRLLDPLQRTGAEAAFIVRNKTVSASSFHHATPENSNNAILQASSASLLKSETACDVSEFINFDFVTNRNEMDNDIPDDVNSEVILVFSIKEAKSVLQFCSYRPELQTILSFHWGGKPMVMESQTESFSVTLVLATLDYNMLSSTRTIAES